MLKNAIVSAVIIRLVQDHRRQAVVMVGALAAILAALLAFGVSERSASAQSEPETVGVVTGLTASAEGQQPGTVRLTWNAAENAQVYFVLFVKADDLASGNYAGVQMRAFNETEATIEGLEAGASYHFIARGMRYNISTFKHVWGDAWSSLTTATAAGVASGTPSTPDVSQPMPTEPQTVGVVTGLTAITDGQPLGTVQLTWDAAENAQVYLVLFVKSDDLASGNYAGVQMRVFNETEATIEGLEAGASYHFIARGLRYNISTFEDVWSDDWSDLTTATLPAEPKIPLSGLEHWDWLEENKPSLASQLKGLSWVADGVGYSERAAAEVLIAAAIWYPDTFNALLQMAWVVDDVTEHETTVIRRIRWTAQDAPALAEPMLQKSWVQDGITRDEATVIEYLYWTIRVKDEGEQQEVIQKAVEILGMPFLDTVESPDALAVRSLERFEDAGSAEFLELMTHPTLSDGITDEETKIVLLLGATNETQPESVSILLDGTDVYTEERSINLPNSGQTSLAIIRLRDRQTLSMDYLEHAVRTAEGFMDEPLPTNYIAWYFSEATDPGARGTNHHTHIATKPYMDDPDDDRWADTPRHIAHEVGHYYWTGSGSQRWIKEGGADLLAYLAENERVGRPVESHRSQCSFFNSISELETADPERGTEEEYCYYSLGSRLFVDLYHTLGEDTFQQGFSGLYLKRLRDDLTDDCEGTGLGICHLEAAFKTGVSDDVVAQVDEVIGRWYYGTLISFSDLGHSARLEESKPALADQIKALPWVADGVDYSERSSAEKLVEAAIWWPDTFDALMRKPWIQDAITHDEATVIEHSYWITRQYNDEATKLRVSEVVVALLDMPFLDSVESADALAVWELGKIARANSDDFLDVMAYPKVSDGITDQEAKVVAVLSSAYNFKPDSLPVLLNGLDGIGGVYLEERTIDLTHSGEVQLTIIRVRNQVTDSMDYLESAVRNVEEFMGESLPTNYVALYFDDATPAGGGYHADTHITSVLNHDDVNHPYWQDTPKHIAHEVGHYYWKGDSNRWWLSEGAADLVSFISENVRIERPLEPDRGPCPYFETISQLELAEYDLGSPENSCNYSLGQRLFLGLYHTLGDANFRQGFRSLYLSAERGRPVGDCEGIGLGICHVEAAFKTGASDNIAAKMDEVIDRWYYGVVTRDEEYSYSISVSDDWTEEMEGQYNHAASGSQLRITSLELGNSVTLAQYATRIRDGLQAEWWENPSLFEITSFHEEQINGQNFYSITYRVQESPEYCVVDVSELVTVSNALPGSQHGYRVRMSMCEGGAADFDQERQQILYSFRVTTEPSTYYRQFLSVKGVVIKAKDTVAPDALYAAGDIVSAMLSGRQDIGDCMANVGAGLAIIPKDEYVTTLPEFADQKGTSDFTGRPRDSFAIRGLGAIKNQPVSATSEEQLLGLSRDEYPHNRFPHIGHITVHEFAHGIHNLCFTQNDWEQWGGFYDAAKQAGIFPGTHMMANVDEFIAVLSTAYFEVTDDIGRGAGRSTVESDFPDAFASLEEIYGGAVLAAEYRERKF